jgi:hypothetical protein
MSKSAGNVILLSDEPDVVRKRVRNMYTDSNLSIINVVHVILVIKRYFCYICSYITNYDPYEHNCTRY